MYVLMANFLLVTTLSASETIEKVPFPMCESILYLVRTSGGSRNSLMAAYRFLKRSIVWTT
jgi:hypothetical protein